MAVAVEQKVVKEKLVYELVCRVPTWVVILMTKGGVGSEVEGIYNWWPVAAREITCKTLPRQRDNPQIRRCTPSFRGYPRAQTLYGGQHHCQQ